jgi:Ca-activated chloride channel homolog
MPMLRLRKSRMNGNSRSLEVGRLIADFVLLLAMSASVAAYAQQPAPATAPSTEQTHADDNNPSASPTTIHATVQLVNVPITALTKHGQRVIDLNQDELRILEDGVEQKIVHFERETRTPLRIGLILETSNSARPRLSYEKEAAQQFTDAVLTGGTNNQEFLETFDVSSSIVQDFTGDPDLMSEKIQGLKAGGGKALYDAVYSACQEKMLKTGPREEVRRILVVISDGLDIQSQHTLDQVISMARMAETMIFTVGTTAHGYANAGDDILEQLALQTGGYPSFPLRNEPGSDVGSGYLAQNQIDGTSENKGSGVTSGDLAMERLDNLAVTLQTIAQNLSEQYSVAYRPQNSALDGSYRTITVETTRRGILLRWKPGYFARAE